MGRKLLAGFLGAVAYFAWSSLAHVVLPLGQTGVQELPNEQAVLTTLKTNISSDGLYFFPGLGKANAPRAERGPTGIMIFHPEGALALKPSQLISEFVTNFVQVLLAVFLLGQTSLASFAARWRFVTVAGVLAAISTNISYWTFYGFPGNYTLAYICIIAMGFVCAGLVVAAMMKPGAGMPAARGAAA